MALCSTLTRTDFLSQVTKPQLLREKDLIFDYDNLKACLDPANELQEDEPSEKATQTKEYYWDFLISLNSWEFTELETLSLRNMRIPSYLELTKRMLSNVFQYDTLQKLDLSQNNLAEVEDLLQFWYLSNLKSVILDSTELTSLPPSIGRLQHLEELSLKKNKLCTLPEIIRFCKNLRVLNLEQNKFKRLPGAILKLQNLEDLWKFRNPMLTTLSSGVTSVGDEYSNHVGLLPCKSTTTTTATSTDNSAPTVHNPQLLQTLCCKVLAQHSVPYWNAPYLPPLMCRSLDMIHTEYNLCENCHVTVPKDEGYIVEVFIVDYLGLKEVAFELVVCSTECSLPVRAKMVEKQKEIRYKLEKEYDDMIEAHRKECEEHEKTVLQKIAANRPRRNRNRNTSRRSACVIM